MPPLLRQPPPVLAAAFAALIGLLLPLPLIVCALAASSHFEDRFPTLRSFVLPGVTLLLFTAIASAVIGCAVCAVLAWATRKGRRRLWPAFALTMSTFADGAAGTLGGFWLAIRGLGGLAMPIVLIASALSGAVMAYSMARAARDLGAVQTLPLPWIIVISAGASGLGIIWALSIGSLAHMQILSVLWLGLVTYFCLKPLPEVPKTGL